MPRRPGAATPQPVHPPRVYLAHELPDPHRGEWASRLRRVRRGAYVEPATTSGWDAARHDALARIAAVARVVADGHVISHESAAVLWGLPLTGTGAAVHLIRPGPANNHVAADVRHHVHRLAPTDVVELDGRLVTSLARTTADCAMSLDPRSALIIADAALAAGLERETVLEGLDRRRGHRGLRRAREVLRYADAGAESPGESSVRHLVLAAGLPVPRTQLAVATADGWAWTDLGWEEWRVAAEYDGVAKYGSGETARESLLAERRREVLIEREGWRVARITAADLRRPRATVGMLLRLAPPGLALTPRPLLRLPPAQSPPAS